MDKMLDILDEFSNRCPICLMGNPVEISADRSASDLQHEIDLSMLMMYGFQGLRDRGFEKILKRLNKKTW